MEFQGFSPETVDFLWGIRMNNNREWFLEHKKEYVNYLYEPMKALGRDLFQPFLDKPGNLLKVSRIYRDTRLHHPLPYKESLWICIRHDVEWWAENPCLFFEITPDDISYGFAWLRPRPPLPRPGSGSSRMIWRQLMPSSISASRTFSIEHRFTALQCRLRPIRNSTDR